MTDTLATKENARSGVRWTGLATVFNIALQLVRTVILARFFLGPAEFGLFALVLSVIYILDAFSDFGTSPSLIWRRKASSDQLSSVYIFSFLVGTLFFSIVFFGAPLFAGLFDEPRLEPLLSASAFIFLTNALGRPYRMLLNRDFQFKTVGIIDVLAVVIAIIVTFGLAFAGAGVWSLVLGNLAENAFMGLACMAAGVKRFPIRLHFKWRDLDGYLSYGLYFQGASILNRITERIDHIILGKLAGTAQLGLYSVPYAISTTPAARINPLLSRVAMPLFASVENDPEKLRRGFILSMEMLSALVSPMLIGLLAVAPVAVPVMFGEKWIEMVPILQFLCILGVSRSMWFHIVNLVASRGRADIYFWWTLFVLALTAPAVAIGAFMNGALGVAVALAITETVLLVCTYFAMVRPITGPMAGRYFAAVFMPIAAALVMAAMVYPIPGLLGGSTSALTLCIQIAAGALIYVAILWNVRPNIITEYIEVVPETITRRLRLDKWLMPKQQVQ